MNMKRLFKTVLKVLIVVSLPVWICPVALGALFCMVGKEIYGDVSDWVDGWLP